MKPFVLTPLPYSYSALAPYIDAETMQLHHDKHHQAYTDKLNAALAVHPELPDKPIEQILANLDSIPADIRVAVKNFGGGYYNHNLFWEMLGQHKVIPSETAELIAENFESVAKFKEIFSAQALALFGSGWLWLVQKQDGSLEIMPTMNQDNPVSSHNVKLLLTIDLWEHAYYLKYQNRRQEYINNWWNVVNWEYVAEALAGK